MKNLIRFSKEDIAREFNESRVGDEGCSFILEYLKDAEIIFSVYEEIPWEGTASILFKKNGELFYVEAGHCSYFGLEGQWEPEKTTWKALDMKKFSMFEDPELNKAIKALIKDNL